MSSKKHTILKKELFKSNQLKKHKSLQLEDYFLSVRKKDKTKFLAAEALVQLSLTPIHVSGMSTISSNTILDLSRPRQDDLIDISDEEYLNYISFKLTENQKNPITHLILGNDMSHEMMIQLLINPLQRWPIHQDSSRLYIHLTFKQCIYILSRSFDTHSLRFSSSNLPRETVFCCGKPNSSWAWFTIDYLLLCDKNANGYLIDWFSGRTSLPKILIRCSGMMCANPHCQVSFSLLELAIIFDQKDLVCFLIQNLKMNLTQTVILKTLSVHSRFFPRVSLKMFAYLVGLSPDRHLFFSPIYTLPGQAYDHPKITLSQLMDFCNLPEEYVQILSSHV